MFSCLTSEGSVWNTSPLNWVDYICYLSEMWLIFKIGFPHRKYLCAGVPAARQAAAANGPPEEPHIPPDPRPAGRPGPDRHAQDWEDRSGVPAGEYTGAQCSTFAIWWNRAVSWEKEASYIDIRIVQLMLASNKVSQGNQEDMGSLIHVFSKGILSKLSSEVFPSLKIYFPSRRLYIPMRRWRWREPSLSRPNSLTSSRPKWTSPPRKKRSGKTL